MVHKFTLISRLVILAMETRHGTVMLGDAKWHAAEPLAAEGGGVGSSKGNRRRTQLDEGEM